ncbi:MAG: hypothetical protein NTZ33_12565 [Bacteroidetes bacterium]|nr:hypothetical protein [Bacteroidota bacterium]
MKTLKIISIAILIIMVSGFVSFAKDNKKDIQKSELKTVLEKVVTFPDFAIDQDQESTVLVQFTITEEGKVEIKAMNYLDVKLGDYVKECLQKVVVAKDDTSVGKTHIFKINFKEL